MPFRQIAGHQHLLELIGRAAVRGSMPPSVIFAGPAGVGKRMAAVALAQLVNCLASETERATKRERSEASLSEAPEGPQGVPNAERWGLKPRRRAPMIDACGECASCRRIARGVHADVLLVEPGETGSIKVDQVRDAIERSAYRPFEGRRRVVIVDEADALMPEAQNALLKTLEEPPSASTFVLVTSRPDVLLPTVLSRCQRLRFGRLAPAEVAAVLVRDHEYSEAEAQAAAALSDGSVGAALEGATDDYAEARHAAAALLQTVAASQDPRRRLQGAKALAPARGGRDGSERDELARRLHAVSSMLRDITILLTRADERQLANADLMPQLRGLLRSFDGERALRAFSAVDRALTALDRNASPKIVADWIAFQI